jgi:hypothetical protein
MSTFVDWLKGEVDKAGAAMQDPNSAGGQLLSLGVANYLKDQTKANVPKVGYQGGIDRVTKVRNRLDVPQSRNEGRATGLLTAQDLTGDKQLMKTVPDTSEGAEEGATMKVPFTEAELASQRMGGDRYARGHERRPGGMGRRYFTDRIYAKTPEEDQERMSLDDARKQNMRQKLEMEGKTEDEIATTMAEMFPDDTSDMAAGGRVRKYAGGGLASMQSGQLFNNGYYLGGTTDGMADKVPARIDGKQEARLSDGEFVIPADVVSHLGNGNSDAGAQQLHNMMDGVRTARTGNPEQGKQINPQEFMPKMAQGGLAQFSQGGGVKRFEEGGDVDADPMVGNLAGEESSLSNWAGDYVTDMLSYGRAEAESPYEAYTGPLTAGSSVLQDQAFTGLQALNNPLSGDSITRQMGSFEPTGANVNRFMNPYQQEVIDRTAADMQRQDQINQLQQRQQLASAGAFGGSRDALLRAEAASNLSRNIGDMAAEQRSQGFTQAMDRAQQRQQDINKYGLDVIAGQAKGGQEQRGIASEGIAADYGQFREERDYDKKAVQYMQSLLQGLPLAAQSYSYTEPSDLDTLMEAKQGLAGILEMFGYSAPTPAPEQEVV